MYYKTNEKDISPIPILHILQFLISRLFSVDVDILDYWNLSWQRTLMKIIEIRQHLKKEVLTPHLLCWSRLCLSAGWSPPPPPSWSGPWPQPGNISIINVKIKSNVTAPSKRDIRVYQYQYAVRRVVGWRVLMIFVITTVSFTYKGESTTTIILMKKMELEVEKADHISLKSWVWDSARVTLVNDDNLDRSTEDT